MFLAMSFPTPSFPTAKMFAADFPDMLSCNNKFESKLNNVSKFLCRVSYRLIALQLKVLYCLMFELFFDNVKYIQCVKCQFLLFIKERTSKNKDFCSEIKYC